MNRKYDPWEYVTAAEGIEGTGRFWVALNNSEIQVGKDGSDVPLMRLPQETSTHAIWSIGLKSIHWQPAEWQIYIPCY